jgi:signal transduction histidine kinase
MDKLNQFPRNDGESITSEGNKNKNMQNNAVSTNLAAEEYQALKSRFISSISHEIRTPLNAILGFSELSLLNDADLTELLDYMKIIHRSSQELLGKIKDIIYLSSLDSGMVPYNSEVISLNGLLKDLYDYYQYHYPSNKPERKKITIGFENTQHIFFRSDAAKLMDLLKRLMNNSIKFTESGTISLTTDLSEKKVIKFVVKDTGIGIPEEKIQVIFEPFASAQDIYSKSYNGSGLGLTIVNHLVNLLGGKLEINSKVDHGTEIKVSIPFNAITNS